MLLHCLQQVKCKLLGKTWFWNPVCTRVVQERRNGVCEKWQAQRASCLLDKVKYSEGAAAVEPNMYNPLAASACATSKAILLAGNLRQADACVWDTAS